MQKFEEIAVARGIKDGKKAGFLLGFWLWNTCTMICLIK